MSADNGKPVLPLPILARRLRALVLALGESASPPWWQTRFMNETGLRFLERLYPRSCFRAAVHAAGRAACDGHDRAVGRVGVYHLFRLPETLEAELNRLPPDADAAFIAAFRTALGQPDRLLALLAPLCREPESREAAPGARRIGTDRDLMTAAAFGNTAACYRQAFAQGRPGFPYFAAEQDGSRG